MLQEILQTLFLIAFILGVLLLGILFRGKLNRQSKLMGVAYISVSLVPLWNGYFKHTESLSILNAPILDRLYPWLPGPLLLLYCRALRGDNLSVQLIAPHCAWPLLVLFISQIADNWLVFMSRHLVLSLYLAVLYCQIFLYIYLAWQNNLQTSLMAQEQYAGSEVEVWKWMALILKGLALIFFLDLVALSANQVGYLDQTTTSSIFVMAESIYVFALIGFTLTQSQLFFNRFDHSKQLKYQNSGLNTRLAPALAGELMDIVDRKQLYLDNELTLAQLAQQLKVPEGHIAQILSEQLGQNFYEFINRKRIEKAKALLLSDTPDYRNILKLAHSVGFNNKTSFNSAFKRFTQLTPGQFRQNASRQVN